MGFADYLLPDLPNGTGFSETDTLDSSILDLESTGVEFFDLLANSSHKNKDKINFTKDRQLIMYGQSYGCALLSLLSSKLLDKGYNVKSLYLESPFMNQTAFVEKFPDMIKGFNIQSGKGLQKWEEHATKCLNRIKATDFSYDDAKFCDQLYGDGPFTNESGIVLLNVTDMRCSKKNYLDNY